MVLLGHEQADAQRVVQRDARQLSGSRTKKPRPGLEACRGFSKFLATALHRCYQALYGCTGCRSALAVSVRVERSRSVSSVHTHPTLVEYVVLNQNGMVEAGPWAKQKHADYYADHSCTEWTVVPRLVGTPDPEGILVVPVDPEPDSPPPTS
jgi:hypothetical protein